MKVVSIKNLKKPISEPRLDLAWAERHLRGFTHSVECVARVRQSEAEYQEFKKRAVL